jgi:hypothetical protein
VPKSGLSGVRAGLLVASRVFFHSHAEIGAGYRQSSLTPSSAYRAELPVVLSWGGMQKSGLPKLERHCREPRANFFIVLLKQE